jgi:outer membrane receptor protein involved in Fe transport
MLYGKYVGNQYIDEANAPDLVIEPYIIFNLSGWLQYDQIRVTARINNLFDTLYATYGYEYYGGYYWPGATRNISLSVEIQI